VGAACPGARRTLPADGFVVVATGTAGAAGAAAIEGATGVTGVVDGSCGAGAAATAGVSGISGVGGAVCTAGTGSAAGDSSGSSSGIVGDCGTSSGDVRAAAFFDCFDDARLLVFFLAGTLSSSPASADTSSVQHTRRPRWRAGILIACFGMTIVFSLTKAVAIHVPACRRGNQRQRQIRSYKTRRRTASFASGA
jgi:hypothetical protein